MNKGTTISLAVIAACGIAFGAVMLKPSDWHKYELQSDATLKANPKDMQKAEDELMKAIEISFKDKVPEKQIVHLYEKMGDLMMAEGKYEDSQKYFLRVLQFNNARHIEPEENIAQLQKLEMAYEKARDYEQAAQTQSVLVKYIEFELSPSSSLYTAAVDKQKDLKVRLAKFENPAGMPKVKLADHVTTDKPTLGEQKAQESLLTGWH